MDFNIDKLSMSKNGRETIMKTLANMSDQSNLKTEELIYWAYYHNLRDDNQFDYLRKVGNMEFPALIRRIPHHRSFLNYLVSKQAKRDFPFMIYTSDVKSQEKKYIDKMKKSVELWQDATKRKMLLAQQQISLIDQQFQQIQDLLSREPESEEMAQMQNELRMQLPSIQVEMEMAKDILTKEMLLSTDELKKIDKFFKFDYKDHKDMIAELMLLKLKATMSLQKKSIRNFISHTVTGRQFYFVDYNVFSKKAVFRPLNGLKVTYPSVETIEWVQDAPWVKIEENWTYNDIIKEYGEILTPEQLESLRKLSPPSSSQGAFIPLQGTKAVAVDHSTKLKMHENDNGVGIKVVRYYWKAERMLKAVQSPNPKRPGKYFTHFIENEKPVINSNDYFYKAAEKKYVHRKNKDEEFLAKDVEVINPSKGDRLEKRYVQDRYDGVCINDNIWLSWRSPVQLRSEDDFSCVPLPVVGKTYNGMTDYPYSLIGQTIPFVDTIEILYYHRELLLALTNIEGVVIDYSQKPTAMTDEEWYYQMKLGRYIIQTVKNGKQVSSFNQFQRVGGAAHSIIQYIDNMIMSTYNFMGEVMGITRQSKGEVRPDDQVGTFEMSIDQSNLVTQIIFEDHDEVAAKAYTILANLYASYCLIDNDYITLGGRDISMYKIEKDFFKNIDLECSVEDTARAARQLQELKTIMKQRSDVGQIPLQHFITMYMTDSVRDLERSVQYFAEEAEKAAAQSMQAQEQAKAEGQARMIQLKGEMDAKLEQMKAEIAGREQQLNASLEEMKLQQKDSIEKAKLALEKEKIDLQRETSTADTQLQLMSLLNEQAVETSLIRENRDARLVDQKINALRLKMEALINGITLELNKNKQKSDHTEAMKKLSIDEKKAKKTPVEHVNDN